MPLYCPSQELTESTLAIFGKTDPSPAPTRDSSPPAAPSTPTVLGPKARFVGELSGDEDVTIEGRLEGKIQTDRRVTIGLSGDVEGDVFARSVVVTGKVRGQILASEKAELAASAVVEGTVQAPKVVIAEGAQLQGSVAMSAPGNAEARSASKPT